MISIILEANNFRMNEVDVRQWRNFQPFELTKTREHLDLRGHRESEEGDRVVGIERARDELLR